MDTIKLIDIVKMIWKRIFIVVIAVVVFLSGALVYCFAIQTPVYSAKATVLFASGVLFDDNVQHINGEYITTAELSTSFALMKSFSGILTKSVDYYNKALAATQKVGLEEEYTREQLMAATTIEYEENSVFLNITVVSRDERDAVTLVTALANSAPDTVKGHLARISATVLNADDKAVNIAPRTATMCVLAVMVAIVLSCIAIILIEVFDKTIKGEDDFTEKHDTPLLGSVPDFEWIGKKGKVNG